jgi:hypothetical protein
MADKESRTKAKIRVLIIPPSGCLKWKSKRYEGELRDRRRLLPVNHLTHLSRIGNRAAYLSTGGHYNLIAPFSKWRRREYGTNGNNETNGKLMDFSFVSLFPFVPYSLLLTLP